MVTCGFLGDVHLRGLQASYVEEQHRDHEQGDNRVEDLVRHVVAQLFGQSDLVLLTAVGQNTPQDQPPDQHADTESSYPRTRPQTGDPGTLTGHAPQQETTLDCLRATTQITARPVQTSARHLLQTQVPSCPGKVNAFRWSVTSQWPKPDYGVTPLWGWK